MVSCQQLYAVIAGPRLSWVGAGRILGDVGVADHATGSRAYRAESAVGDFGAVSIALVIAAPLGSFGRYYWLA